MKDRLITLAMALLALGISVVLLAPPQPPAPKISVPTSEDRGASGHKGLAEWLRRKGVAVTSLRTRYDRLPPGAQSDGHGHVLIISLPAQKHLENSEWQALQHWLEAGNTVLILGAAYWQPDWTQEEACFCEVSQLLEPFGWSLERDDPEPEAQPSPDGDMNYRDRLAALQAGIRAQMPMDGQLSAIAGQPLTAGVERLSSQVVPHLMQPIWLLRTENADNLALNLLLRPDDQAVAFWQISAGSGQVFLSLAPDLFSNQRLGEADNARFLANLLNQALAKGAQVIFDDYHFGLSELYDPDRFFSDDRLHRSLAFMALMWLLYVAGYSNRLAPVRPRPVKLSMRDFVDVTAGFFARRVPEPAIAQELLRQFLLDLRQWRRLDDERQAWLWLERHPQIAPIDLATLQGVRAGQRVSLLQLTQSLQQIRKLAL